MTTLAGNLPTSREWESVEAAGNGPAWLAVDLSSGETVVHEIAPANDKPDGLYKWSIDGDNPAYAFPREFVPALLAMGLDAAKAWLYARVTPANKIYGMPWYVRSDTVQPGLVYIDGMPHAKRADGTVTTWLGGH